jgi:molecular chaperone DnaK (HSP70)
MLAEAEKYASLDKEKRENIDLKNQAEALCFEAEKELISSSKIIFLKINNKILQN